MKKTVVLICILFASYSICQAQNKSNFFVEPSFGFSIYTASSYVDDGYGYYKFVHPSFILFSTDVSLFYRNKFLNAGLGINFFRAYNGGRIKDLVRRSYLTNASIIFGFNVLGFSKFVNQYFGPYVSIHGLSDYFYFKRPTKYSRRIGLEYINDKIHLSAFYGLYTFTDAYTELYKSKNTESINRNNFEVGICLAFVIPLRFSR